MGDGPCRHSSRHGRAPHRLEAVYVRRAIDQWIDVRRAQVRAIQLDVGVDVDPARVDADGAAFADREVDAGGLQQEKSGNREALRRARTVFVPAR